MNQRRSIQDLVSEVLTEMGLPAACLARTILLRERYVVGHKYRFQGGYAVWLAEKNVVEVYDEGGKLLRTVAADAETKKAA